MSFKSQSAMEYLMTYGWAILIIAVVIVAIFQLGIFNNSNLVPHALSGACEVVRNAAGSSLAGQCNNEIPQSVAVFDGASSYISVGNLPQIGSTTAWAVSFWMDSAAVVSYDNSLDANFVPIGNNEGPRFEQATGGSFAVVVGNGAGQYLEGTYTTSLLPNTWYYVVVIRSGNNLIGYLNGAQVFNTGGTYWPPGFANLTIGQGYSSSRKFDGQISNVQIYNTSLSANEISALYLEGIGGAPIDPTHIVGWWPLNGNAQDYSGNNNGGVPTNVAYTSSWASGYTAP